MSFINPAVLSLLLLLPLLVVFVLWRERLREHRLQALGNVSTLLAATTPVSPLRRRWKLIMWLFAFAMLVVALARPVWGEELTTLETQGISIMVLLDVSKSMNVQDIVPSRLERAKLDIQQLFNRLSVNEVGLILFAGEAFIQFPLTNDITSATTLLQSVSTDAISRQGTNVDAALRLAQRSFNQEISSKRVVILVTDGENHEGDPLQAAQVTAEQGITVYALGYGTPEGAAIPVYDAEGVFLGDQTDVNGATILSRLDENTLSAIADRTGGSYQRVNPNGAEITNLLNTLAGLQDTALGSQVEVKGIERFELFVALAVLALSLEMLLPEVKKQIAA